MTKFCFLPIPVRLFLVGLTAGTLLVFMPAPHSSATPTPTVPAATASPALTATPAAPTATPPAQGSPLARIIDLVTNLNAGDLASVYAAVSPDVQQQFTLDQLTEAIQNFEQGTGQIHMTLVSVDSTSQAGDEADIELTLRIQAGSAIDVTLRDVTSLVRVNGVWRLADHFLQSAFTAIGLVRPGPLQRTFDAQGCVSGDVLAGVYASSRLHVIQPCVIASGVVHNVESSLDGDISFNLALQPDKAFLLNDGNRRDQTGMLVVEIIPGDQQRLERPTEGEAITITGPWVTDTIHGWNEIHPVWRIERQGAGALPSSGSGGPAAPHRASSTSAILLAFAGALLIAGGAAVRRQPA